MATFRSRVVVGSGRQQMEVNLGFVKSFERMIAATLPRSMRLMQDATAETEDHARRLWPVKLITSRQRFVAIKALERGDRKTYHSILATARARYQKAKSDPKRSRNRFDSVVRLSAKAIEVGTRNTAAYAYFIKPAWPYEDVINSTVRVKNPARDLLLKPGTKKRKVDALARVLADELARIEAGR